MSTKNHFKIFLILNSLHLLVLLCGQCWLYLYIHCCIYSRHYSRAGKFSLDYYTVLVFISHSSSRLSPQLATTVAATLAMLGSLLLLVLVR